MNTLLRALLVGLVASTLIVACSQKTEEIKVNPAITIEAANAKWNKALNSGNVKELAALYTENATCLLYTSYNSKPFTLCDSHIYCDITWVIFISEKRHRFCW